MERATQLLLGLAIALVGLQVGLAWWEYDWAHAGPRPSESLQSAASNGRNLVVLGFWLSAAGWFARVGGRGAPRGIRWTAWLTAAAALTYATFRIVVHARLYTNPTLERAVSIGLLASPLAFYAAVWRGAGLRGLGRFAAAAFVTQVAVCSAAVALVVHMRAFILAFDTTITALILAKVFVEAAPVLPLALFLWGWRRTAPRPG